MWFYRGEQCDQTLGLYYLRARYYNPATGRFMSRDPEGGKTSNPRTLHKYLFVGGDPVNRIDPRGRGEIEYVGQLNFSLNQAVKYANVVGCAIAIGSTAMTSILMESLKNIDPSSTFSTAFGCITALMEPDAVVNVGFTALGLEGCAVSLAQAVEDENAYNKDPSAENSAKVAGDLVGSIGGCATTAFATSLSLFAP